MDETNKKKMGRLPINDPASFRYTIRMNAVTNDKFLTLFERSKAHNKTKFILSCIFGKPIKVVQIDKGMLDFYMRLTTFFGQFRAIGTNYNQITKALKTNFSEKKALVMLYKLEKETIELVRLQRQVTGLIEEFEEKYSDLWLGK